MFEVTRAANLWLVKVGLPGWPSGDWKTRDIRYTFTILPGPRAAPDPKAIRANCLICACRLGASAASKEMGMEFRAAPPTTMLETVAWYYLTTFDLYCEYGIANWFHPNRLKNKKKLVSTQGVSLIFVPISLMELFISSPRQGWPGAPNPWQVRMGKAPTLGWMRCFSWFNGIMELLTWYRSISL